MIVVNLHGFLAERYGDKFEFAANTAAECIAALCANFPDFKKTIREEETYCVADNDGGSYDAEELAGPGCSVGEIHIVPVISGSGFFSRFFKNVFKFVAGAALLALGTLPGLQFFSYMGVSMILGGVSDLLMGDPPTPTSQEADENRPSFAFGGVVNTTQQGSCVPVLYGRMIVGSQTLSSGITTQDITEDG